MGVGTKPGTTSPMALSIQTPTTAAMHASARSSGRRRIGCSVRITPATMRRAIALQIHGTRAR
jgi:hypothetical protein